MDIDRYADLLNSVGQQGTGNKHQRPLSPVECAEAIRRIQDEEGDSLEQVARRLNLGNPKDTSNMYKKRDTSQVTMFLNLLNISKKIRDLAGWSTDEYPKIPFSIIAQLSTMTEEEQNIIVQSILKSKSKKRLLVKEDVKKIKKWRNENPNLSIKECVEDVLKLKPVTVITHMVVVELNGKLCQFVNSNKNYEEKLLDLLRENLVGKFYNIKLGNSIMVISMDDEAYKIFYDSQYKKKISFTAFLNNFLEDKIG